MREADSKNETMEQTQSVQQYITEKGNLMRNISIVLANPKYANNVGAVARCAKNMNIHSIKIVNGHTMEDGEINRTATHGAMDVVQSITSCRSVGEALQDFQFVVGATARKGSARGPAYTPREVAQEIINMATNNKVALLFGSENKGLSNDELFFCHRIINIPTSDTFTSINLSHAVMIVCYEIFVANMNTTKQFSPKIASVGETERMFEHMAQMFVKVGFLNKENPSYWMRHIRTFFARTKILSKEVKIVRGILRQLEWYINSQQRTKE